MTSNYHNRVEFCNNFELQNLIELCKKYRTDLTCGKPYHLRQLLAYLNDGKEPLDSEIDRYNVFPKYKVLFLDIDGVLVINNNTFCEFDKDCLERLKEIICTTNAKIVITSTMRIFEESFQMIVDNLEGIGIDKKHIIGVTELLSNKNRTHNLQIEIESRCAEIANFLKENEVKDYFILDDMDLSAFEKDRFIKIDSHLGITESVKLQCINKLKEV